MSNDTLEGVIESLKILEQLVTLQQQTIKQLAKMVDTLDHKIEVLQEKVFDE